MSNTITADCATTADLRAEDVGYHKACGSED